MALPANWYFGSKPYDEQFGGFNLGGVQTPFQTPPNTVSAPAAGVAGSAPGQPPSSSGGMTALSVPFDQPSSGPSAEPASDPGNANVTGFNGPLANAAITAATLGMPNPFAGLGLIGGLGANFAARAGLGMGVGSIPSNLSTNGQMIADSGTTIPSGTPVTYSGNNTFGLPTGSLVANVPTPNPRANDDGITPQGLSVMVPSQSPNMANFGNPNAPGIFSSDDTTQIADTGLPGPTGVATGNPGNGTPTGGNNTDFGDSPVGQGQTPGPAGQGQTGDTGGGPGAGAGPGSGAAGASGGAPGAGDAGGGSAGSGGTGAGASAGDRRGGVVGQERERAQARQRGQRPDARMLAAKLQRGARVDVGKRANVDSVPVKLARGEMVINRAATRANLPELERINASAPRSAGGMAVGRPREARR